MGDETKLREMMAQQDITTLLLASTVLSKLGCADLAYQVREVAEGARAGLKANARDAAGGCASCTNTGRTPNGDYCTCKMGLDLKQAEVWIRKRATRQTRERTREVARILEAL